MGAFLQQLGGGLLDVVGDLVSTKYQSDLEGHRIDRQFEQNKNQSELAFERERQASIDFFNLKNAREDAVWEREKAYNLDMWNKMNEYNAPTAQMARLKSAGLNPLLAYSQGTTGNAVAIRGSDIGSGELSRPSYHPATVDRSRRDISNLGSRFMTGVLSYMGVRQAGLQNQNLSAQNALISANAKVAHENARALKHENDLLEGTRISRSDPQMLRVGGRIGRFLNKIWSDLDPKSRSFWSRYFQNSEGDVENPELMPIRLRIEGR